MTVSPDFIAGRSASCAFSTSSIAPMSPAPSSSAASARSSSSSVASSIRSGRRSSVRLSASAFPPAPDLRVIARQQHVRARCSVAPISARPRVLRKVQQPAAERILRHRLLVADHARHEPRDRVDDRPAPAARRRSARSRRSTAPRSTRSRTRSSNPRSARTAARRARSRLSRCASACVNAPALRRRQHHRQRPSRARPRSRRAPGRSAPASAPSPVRRRTAHRPRRDAGRS